MSKNRLLTIAVICLLVINFATLTFLLFSQHRPPFRSGADREGPASLIIERLHFDTQQITAYHLLINVHRSSIRKLDGEIRATKNALYGTLAQDDPGNADSLKNKLSRLQSAIENVHYDHFAAIKKLCKPNQLGYFNDLTNDLAGYFSPSKVHPPGEEGPPN